MNSPDKTSTTTAPYLSRLQLESLMLIALKEAEKARDLGEVPIGAVVARGEEVLAVAHNEVESRKDPTAHAELLALESSSSKLDRCNMQDVTLVVTVEPCTMCIGAIKLWRVPLLIFGVAEPKMGACGSLYDLSLTYGAQPKIKVISGVCAEQSLRLLQRFFERLR